MSYPALMWCRFSLALGAVCPCPATWLPEVWARCDAHGFPFALTPEPGASQPSARRSPGAQQVAIPRSHLIPLPPAAQRQPLFCSSTVGLHQDLFPGASSSALASHTSYTIHSQLPAQPSSISALSKNYFGVQRQFKLHLGKKPKTLTIYL